MKPPGKATALNVVMICLPGIATVGCAETARKPSAPAAERQQLKIPQVAAGTRTDEQTAERDSGQRFVSVVELDVPQGVSLLCFPLLNVIAPLPSGAVWVAGNCGFRFRVAPNGTIQDMRVAPRAMSRQLTGVPHECDATALFWDLWARSETEAYAVSTLSCGIDPSLIWNRAPDRFDGTKWKPLEVNVEPADSCEGMPDILAGSGEALYGIKTRSAFCSYDCDVYRYGDGTWGESMRQCKWDKDEEASETYVDAAVAPDGTLWIVGALNSTPKRGAAWSWDGHSWRRQLIDDEGLTALSISQDGTVWLGGRSLWRRRGVSFEKLTTHEAPINSVWAENRERAWLVRDDVRVFEKNKETTVPHSHPDEDHLTQIGGGGGHVWLLSARRVWRLTTTGAAPVTPAVIPVPVQEDGE